MRTRWLVLSAVGCAAVAALAYDAAIRPLPRLPETASLQIAEPTTTVQLRFDAPPELRFAAVAQRPLFSPSRRPPVREADAPIVAQEQTPPAPPPRLMLSGIAATADSRRAIVSVGDAPPTLVSVGGRIGDWRIVEIGSGGISIELDGRRVAVEISDEIGGGGATTSSRPDAARTRPGEAVRPTNQRLTIGQDDDED